MHDDKVACIASATAAYGMQSWLPNWLPAERHEELRELLYDLTVSALHAFTDGEVWRVPKPSNN